MPPAETPHFPEGERHARTTSEPPYPWLGGPGPQEFGLLQSLLDLGSMLEDMFEDLRRAMPSGATIDDLAIEYRRLVAESRPAGHTAQARPVAD